jgi:hypothetical protein
VRPSGCRVTFRTRFSSAICLLCDRELSRSFSLQRSTRRPGCGPALMRIASLGLIIVPPSRRKPEHVVGSIAPWRPATSSSTSMRSHGRWEPRLPRLPYSSPCHNRRGYKSTGFTSSRSIREAKTGVTVVSWRLTVPMLCECPDPHPSWSEPSPRALTARSWSRNAQRNLRDALTRHLIANWLRRAFSA